MKNNEEMRELVIARLSTFPSNRKISIGRHGELTKEDLIRHIQHNDDIGKKFIEIELAYLKALTKGITV
jgi:hypothetical protein